MRSAHRFSRLVRWTRVLVCFACVGMVPLKFGSASSIQQQPSVPSQPIIPAAYSIECENLIGSAQTTGTNPGTVNRQDMRSFGRGWSGNAQLFWSGISSGIEPLFPSDSLRRPDRAQGQPGPPRLVLSFNAPATGNYLIVLHYTTAPDYGIFKVFVDSQRVGGNIDGYAAKVAPKAESLGRQKLAGGSHQFVLELSGKHDFTGDSAQLIEHYIKDKKGYSFGLDRIELRPIAQRRNKQ